MPLSKEVIELRNAYVTAGVLGVKWIDDATRVAAATVARADAIVSWNFAHIVRLDKMKAYNHVNLHKLTAVKIEYRMRNARSVYVP